MRVFRAATVMERLNASATPKPLSYVRGSVKAIPLLRNPPKADATLVAAFLFLFECDLLLVFWNYRVVA